VLVAQLTGVAGFLSNWSTQGGRGATRRLWWRCQEKIVGRG